MPLTNLSPIQYTKNYAINGDMGIAQRGTSVTSIANGAFTVDRFRYGKSGAMVHNFSQDTDVPGLAQAGYLFQSSLRLTLTTPDTSIGAAESCFIQQAIEGYNWAAIAQKAFTVSFWVKATLAGVYCFALQNSASDRCFVQEYTIASSNTWQQVVINVAASPSAGTWNYTNGGGVYLLWTIAAGSNFQTTPGAWQSGGDVRCTANQVNGVNTGATDFRLTGVMVNEGVAAAPFQLFSANSAQSELSACMRYYELFTGKNTISGYNNTTTTVLAGTPFRVPKRTASWTLAISTNYATNTRTGGAAAQSPTSFAAAAGSAVTFSITCSITSTTANTPINIYCISDTEFIGADAEI